jgi:hypothetical protein
MTESSESDLFLPKRDRSTTAFFLSIGLALAVTVGVAFSAAATGTIQEVLRALGFDKTTALALERQATAVDEMRADAVNLRGALVRLDKTYRYLGQDVGRLQSRMERSGQTDIAIIDRIGGLAAEIVELRTEMVALRGAATEAARRAEVAAAQRFARLDSDVAVLKDELAATDRFTRIDVELAALKDQVATVQLATDSANGDAPWRAHVDDLNANLARAGIEIGALRSTLAVRDDTRRAEIAAQRNEVAALAKRIDRIELAAAAAREVTGSVRSGSAAKRSRQRVLSGWSVDNADRQTAVISGAGRTYEVKTGSIVPGLGRVSDVRQRGKGWIVITEKGVIAQR